MIIDFHKKVNFNRDDFYLHEPELEQFCAVLTGKDTINKAQLLAVKEYHAYLCKKHKLGEAELRHQVDPDEVAF